SLELGVGVELDLDRAAAGLALEPHARAESARQLVGEAAPVNVTRRRRALRGARSARLGKAFGLALREPLGGDLAGELGLLGRAADAEHGACMACRQLAALELRLDGIGEPEQP